MQQKSSKDIQTVLGILNDEVMGNVGAALKKMTPDYQMTWMYKEKNGELFPKTAADIKNIAEGENVVMVELIESYPDPKTKKIHRTPLVLVLEMKDGKIKKGRHYCDPHISYLFLDQQKIQDAYR